MPRFLTAIVIACAIFFQGATHGGVLAKQEFSKRELAGFKQLETLSQDKTRTVQGGSGEWLFKPQTIFAILLLIGIGVWAAHGFRVEEDECIINGVRIDSNSRECRDAARLSRED